MLKLVRLEFWNVLLPFRNQRYVTFLAPWINDTAFVLAVPGADAGAGGCRLSRHGDVGWILLVVGWMFGMRR